MRRWREGTAGVSGEEWGGSGSLSVPKGHVLHTVHEMLGAGAGGIQILANCLNNTDFALPGERRGDASAT